MIPALSSQILFQKDTTACPYRNDKLYRDFKGHTVWSEGRTQGSINRRGVLVTQTNSRTVCHHGAGSKVSQIGEALVYLVPDIYR